VVDEKILAYLAGLIDGEGSIMIKKSTYRIRSPKYNDCVNPGYFIRVTMKNINKDVMELLKKTFGGSVWEDRKVYTSKNGFQTRHRLWCFDIHDRHAENMLRLLYPYLIIKKPQAEIALKLVEMKREARKALVGNAYPPQFVQKFEELYHEIKRLNHK